MQRLFSTFANGWPGFGLLIQRLVTGTVLICQGVTQWKDPAAGLMIPDLAGALVGPFILIGLWTPVTGALVAVIEIGIVLMSGTSYPLPPILLAALGATLAMIGPGAWSLDARLFGRKHIAG